LLRVDLKPARTLPPKIDFNVNNMVGTLRVRDLWLFDAPTEAQPGDEDDPDMPKDSGTRRPPNAQGWEIRLVPSGPTDFVLRCDRGQGTFDFTDLPVRNVHLVADTTEVEITFERPNLVLLERLKATVRSGEAKFDRFLNANARSVTLQLDDTKCQLDLSGEPKSCDTEIFVEGVPKELEITLSKSAALHVEARPANIGRFDREGFVRQDLALVSADWTANKRRVKLFVAQTIPKLTVQWTD
jgi:hypothetical protein